MSVVETAVVEALHETLRLRFVDPPEGRRRQTDEHSLVAA